VQFRRPSPLNVHLELSSLIDVIFLLLIFFMVSSTFIEEAALEIDLPESSSTAESPTDALDLLVKPDDTLVLDGQPVAIGELAARLRAAKEEAPDRPLMVKGDQDARHGTMVKVYDALSEAGYQKATIDAVPAKEAAPGAGKAP